MEDEFSTRSIEPRPCGNWLLQHHFRGLDEEVVIVSESCFITSLWNLIGMTRKMKAEIDSSMVGPNPPRSFTESGYKEAFELGPYDTESSMQIMAPRTLILEIISPNFWSKVT